MGRSFLAGSTSVTGGAFQTKTFSLPFNTVPIIIATVVTQNEVSAVAVQIAKYHDHRFSDSVVGARGQYAIACGGDGALSGMGARERDRQRPRL